MNEDQPGLEAVPSPEEAAVAAADQPTEIPVPPKVTMLRPHSINIEKLEDGSASIEMLITPFEVVAFTVPAAAVDEFVRVLSGGVHIAREMPRMDIPRGRRP